MCVLFCTYVVRVLGGSESWSISPTSQK